MSSETGVVVLEGEAGTGLGAAGRVTIIVDALRSSATICAALDSGAREVRVVTDVGTAREMAAADPALITAGERGGRTLPGFQYGNSPLALSKARLQGQTVVLTTTTGARRIVAARGAPEILIGGVTNRSAVASAALEAARRSHADIVVVAAGNAGPPENGEREAIEDLAAASLIAAALAESGAAIEPGEEIRIPPEALPSLFRNCPNGRHLKAIGFSGDVDLCARLDRTKTVPRVAEWIGPSEVGAVAVLRPTPGSRKPGAAGKKDG